MSFFKKLKKKIKEEIQIGKKKVEKEKTEKEWLTPEGKLTIDVYKTDEEIIIQAPVAGVRPEDLNISTKGDVITIKGYREKPVEVEKQDYFSQECYWGKFSRQIILPEETDPGRTEAAIKNGILTIKIPKIHREKERIVEIKDGKR